MNDLMRTVLIIVVSSFIFNLIFHQLYKINRGLFSFTKKIPEKWKGNWIIRWIIMIVIMTIISVLVVMVGLNDTIGKIIIGFFISFTDLILRKPKQIN